jgi:hypothetical protein
MTLANAGIESIAITKGMLKKIFIRLPSGFEQIPASGRDKDDLFAFPGAFSAG